MGRLRHVTRPMERQGFSRMITADDGRTYSLPCAEYNATANLTSMQVLDVAQMAANTTGKKNSFIVTEAKSRAWSGLTITRN
jgi:hypothetical protein